MGCGGPDWMECMGYVPPQLVWLSLVAGMVAGHWLTLMWVYRNPKTESKPKCGICKTVRCRLHHDKAHREGGDP